MAEILETFKDILFREFQLFYPRVRVLRVFRPPLPITTLWIFWVTGFF